MKFFIAQFATETNTFAFAPTGYGAWAEYGIYRGDGSIADAEGGGIILAALRAQIERDGDEVVESLCAFAQPNGPTVRAVYEDFREQILDDLRAALPVDGVVLALHGAMVAEGYDDCEGDLLARVREIVGPHVPIGAELDLHCHFTELMRRSADAIVAFKEYPHVDGVPRALELHRIIRDAARGLVRPAIAAYDCRMVGIWHTTREPMMSFVRRMQSFEGKDGVLSVSLGHGFPWGDVPEAGAKIWVVSDGDPDGAARLARQLSSEFWELRDYTRAETLNAGEAIDAALADDGTTVMAEIADNPGGGAPGDSTFLLRALLECGVRDVAIGAFWDLGAVAICRDAGVGAVLDLRIGGKCGPASGDPVDVRVTVRAVVEGHSQAGLGGGRSQLGTSVWVEAANGFDILLCSIRTQLFWPDAFTGVGIDLTGKRVIAVKSTQHFHAGFAPLASRVIYVQTSGAISQDFATIPYRVRDTNYWPRIDNPFEGSAR
jgi:microcystin degradation protein MlrC